MKFAQEFKKSLQEEGFPQDWVDSAIPYGQLKKCIKKVTKELHTLGLDPAVLSLLATSTYRGSSDGQQLQDPHFQYELGTATDESRRLRPRLTLFVHINDGAVIDAELTPSTRAFLEKAAAAQASRRLTQYSHDFTVTRQSASNPADEDLGNADTNPASSRESTSTRDTKSGCLQRIEVQLVFDGEFFDILQDDVSALDALQNRQQESMTQEIEALGRKITEVTIPTKSKRKKDDLSRWRDIFELYLDARIFFSTRESDHGAKTSTQAVEQLKWFQAEVLRRNLIDSFELPASHQAFIRFVNMNILLLQNLKFQEINQIAITKILKKFGKRTSLHAAKSFPGIIRSNRLLTGSLAKDICAQVSTKLLAKVPQLDDYLCPICLSIAYWPIRLQCQHIFCSRCMVKMQRKAEGHCPLCRGNVVMRAGLENLDHDHAKFLKRYFPREVKEKQKANELERGREVYGEAFTDRPCIVM